MQIQSLRVFGAYRMINTVARIHHIVIVCVFSTREQMHEGVSLYRFIIGHAHMVTALCTCTYWFLKVCYARARMNSPGQRPRECQIPTNVFLNSELLDLLCLLVLIPAMSGFHYSICQVFWVLISALLCGYVLLCSVVQVVVDIEIIEIEFFDRCVYGGRRAPQAAQKYSCQSVAWVSGLCTAQ